MKTVAFIPIKLNNERLPGKNLKRFDNGDPLITYILNTALKVNLLENVYVYCSSENVRDYLPTGVTFLERPSSLDLSSTSITDVFSAFARAITADVYTLLHATSPFVSTGSIERGLKAVQSSEYDSALAVKRHYDFLWRCGKAVNYDVLNIPRTQDLEPFFTETAGLYIFTKTLAEQRRRIGDKPFLVEVSDIEAIDINEPVDFEIANAVYNHIIIRH